MNPESGDRNNNQSVPGAQNAPVRKPTGPLVMDFSRVPQHAQPQPQPQAPVQQNQPQVAQQAPQMQGTAIDGVAPKSRSRFKKHHMTRSEYLPQISNAAGIEPNDSKKPKALIALIIIAVLAVVAIIVLAILFRGGNINWKEAYGDINLDYITQTTVKLAVDADQSVLDGVSYEGSCDRNEKVKKPERDGNDVKWDLSAGAGKCTIKAKYQLRTIEKTFTVISKEIEREKLGLEDIYRININSDDDEDGDGLTNKREKTIGTKIDLTDTDGDGLADGYEVDTLKTDPLKADTDGDGLNDSSETKLGFNPLKEDSKGDGVKDGDRKNSYTYRDNGAIVKITGKGDIANITVDVTNGAALSKKTGLVPRLYSFYVAGNAEDVTVTISYSLSELNSARVSENNLVIYRYILAEDKYEAVNTKVDANNKTVTAKIDDLSSYYIIGSSKGANLDRTGSEIMFVLDNSWSMYSNDQYKKLKGMDYNGKMDANDPDGLRFKMTKELAERLDKKGVKIGIGEFNGGYVTVKKVGTKIDELKTTLDGMNEHFNIEEAGTNIAAAIEGGAKELSDKAGLKTVVILTDGGGKRDFAAAVNSLTNKMISQNVRVCVLGFSEGAYSDDFNMIANKTGCKVFSSTNVTGLDEVFDNLEILLNDELADVNDDGKMDGYVMADSGFIVTRDGFSFRNYSSDLMTNGHCYGMATFAQLYYSKKMPLRHDVIKANDQQSYAYNLNWSYFKDYQNLYDYKLRTNALKYVPQFGANYFGEQEVADKYIMSEGSMTFNSKVRDEINKTGLFDYYKAKAGMKADAQVQKFGFSYDTIEKARLSETKMQNSAKMDDIDRSLMNAIFASQIRQNSVKMYSSGSAIGINATNVGASTKRMTNSNDFISLLASRIRKHEAPVILAYFSGGLHAMNAINLIQDAKDSNHYYIGVYDSNYPGEKRYLELKCSKFSCTTKANDYYGESGEVIRISISQEEDLKHFEEEVVEYSWN